MDDTSLTNE